MMRRRASRRTPVVLMVAALIAAGCGADDPIAAEPPTTSSPSTTASTSTANGGTTSSSAVTTTSTDPVADANDDVAAVIRAEIPDDWTAIELDIEYPDLVVLDSGDEADRRQLHYGGDRAATFDIDIDNGNQIHRTTMRGTTAATSAGLWITVGVVDSDHPDLDGVDGPFGVAVAHDGEATIYAPAGRTWDVNAAYAIWDTVAGNLLALPAEPVGVGAQWRRETATALETEGATVYSVIDINGSLVTIGHGGILHGGVTTIDTSSGRVMGQIETDDGIIVIDSATAASVPGLPVALTIENEATGSGEPTGGFAVTYFGESAGPDATRRVPRFHGIAAGGSGFGTPLAASFDGNEGWSGSQFEGALAALYESVMPVWAVGQSMIDQDPRLAEAVYLTGVGIGGTSVPARWELTEQVGSTITVRVDDTFSQDEVHRGYGFTVAGTVQGEFTVDRFHPFDVAGELTVEFEVRDDNGVRSAVQMWRAGPASVAEREGWATFDFRADPPVTEVISIGAGPGLAVARTYGGGTWSGTTTMEQTWSRQWDQDDGATFRMTADVDSSYRPEGQVVEFSDASVQSSLSALSEEALAPGPFALVASPHRIGRLSDQHSPSEHPWPFYEVLAQITDVTMPAFPDEPIGQGARWTVAPANQPEAVIATFTVEESEGHIATLRVIAPIDEYYGDRNDGWTIEARLAGLITIDLSASVVLSADLVADGTATFGTGGVPDPATTEPWQQTLTITTEAA